jgi:hypothetical protein
MSTIVLRSTKGSALTFAEGDANFSNLNTDKLENINSESIGDLSDVDISSLTNGYVLTYNSTSGNLELQAAAAGGISNVVEDTTPQLGGTLDGQANTVQDVQLENYKETVYTGGSTTGTITPDVANGNVQSITLSGSITFNAFANAEAGQSMTLIIKQPTSGGPHTLTSTMAFATDNTLSNTNSAVDIMTVLYDGSTYYASLATGFA